jgi:hypothetical protein
MFCIPAPGLSRALPSRSSSITENASRQITSWAWLKTGATQLQKLKRAIRAEFFAPPFAVFATFFRS